MPNCKQDSDYIVIFRRYKKGKDGKLMDAYSYGKRAWPIKIKKKVI